MGSVNKAILVGNLGRDAELSYTPGGAAVASMNMATTDLFTIEEGQKQEDTQWHRVVLSGNTAESMQPYLTKGKQIYVEGKIQTREWTDKDGKQVRRPRFVATAWCCLAAAARGGGGDRAHGGYGQGRRARRPLRSTDDGGPAEES